jgi:hypothetical protein
MGQVVALREEKVVLETREARIEIQPATDTTRNTTACPRITTEPAKKLARTISRGSLLSEEMQQKIHKVQ